MLAKAEETGAYIMNRLRQMQLNHPSIGDVRGRGLMVGIEFVEDQITKKRASALRTAVIEHSFDKGLLVIPCGPNVIRMTPPLNISRDLVDEGLHLFEEALTIAEREAMAVAGD